MKATKPKHPTSRPPAPYKIVLVEWEDSVRPVSEWQWVDEYQIPKKVLCISVGYLIAQTKEALAIAPNLGDIGRERHQASGIIRIPLSALRKLIKL